MTTYEIENAQSPPGVTVPAPEGRNGNSPVAPTGRGES